MSSQQQNQTLFPETEARNEIQELKDKLEKAKDQLKQEFIGIDEVVDRVVDALGSWYLNPSLQEKPNTVCMWGMTGTGKTSLVLRLRELLGLETRFYRLDLGERNYSLTDKLEAVYDTLNGAAPFLLHVDEFHLAKTLDVRGKETENPNLRVLWQVLDQGVFYLHKHTQEVQTLQRLKKVLDYLLQMGMKVKEGHVVGGKALFDQYFPRDSVFMGKAKSKEETPFLLGKDMLEDIRTISEGKYESIMEVEQEVAKKNGKELSQFLGDVIEEGQVPKRVDCTKAFIVVSGNLDEAYRIGADADIEADPNELHRRSKEINVPQIKEALRVRFRSEQLGRLGNNHILYPAFSTSDFQEIIQKDLDRIRKKVEEQEGIALQFHNTVPELVFEEGVYPTQGTRPVYSTIQQMVESRLGYMISHCKLLNGAVGQIWLSAKRDELIAEFYSPDEEKLDELRFQIHRDLGELRKSKRDDKQALCAVHEAGHTVLSIILNKEVPDRLVSHSTTNGNNGYTSFPDRDREPFTKEELENKVIVLLGGIVAEEMVFGEEKVSLGSGDDLQKATTLLLKMIKENGLDGTPGHFMINDRTDGSYGLKDHQHEMDAKAKERLQEWKERARQLLEENEGLLLKIAQRASNERKLSKEDLMTVLKEVCPRRYREIREEGCRRNRFRQMLKRRIAEREKEKALVVNGNRKR